MHSNGSALLQFCLLLVFAQATALLAEAINVGEQIRSKAWNRIRHSSRFVVVDSDSIWMWDVVPNTNLSAGIPERGGRFGYINPLGFSPLGDGEKIYDINENTFIDPDQIRQIKRTTPLILDLGFAFRINRIRLFPRLDRQNQRRFLQQFSVATSAEGIADFEPLFEYPPHRPNTEPVVDRRFTSRTARFIRLIPTTVRPWEIAELQVFGDGTVPVGEYVSLPQAARWSNIVWSKVRFEGGTISQASAVVQTRTGPDDEPQHFFYRPVAGVDEFERIDQEDYRLLEEDQKGPIKPNPAWSAWQTVSDELIRSPGLRRYLQFRVLFTVPGTKLRQLSFEYIRPPVAQNLEAEIHPLVVAPGAKTSFTLSLQIHLKTTDSRDSGFTHVQVRTDAKIEQIEQVLVDDQPVFFSASHQPGQGFTVNLFRQIEQNGTFIQLHFTGRVFRDRTRFEVGALDRRTTDEGVEEAFQIAQAADIDQELPGGSLEVRLEDKKGRLPLIANIQPVSSLFTPNGDRVNDSFILSYNLLKLVTPAAVSVHIYDLGGRLVQRAYEGADGNGQYTRSWDGLDAQGRLVPPGLYLYEIQVKADVDTERRLGTVGVTY